MDHCLTVLSQEPEYKKPLSTVNEVTPQECPDRVRTNRKSLIRQTLIKESFDPLIRKSMFSGRPRRLYRIIVDRLFFISLLCHPILLCNLDIFQRQVTGTTENPHQLIPNSFSRQLGVYTAPNSLAFIIINDRSGLCMI